MSSEPLRNSAHRRRSGSDRRRRRATRNHDSSRLEDPTDAGALRTEVKCLDAVIASSAFLDYEQDKVGEGGIAESSINALLLDLTMTWEDNIPNYHRTPDQFLRMQINHDRLPAPSSRPDLLSALRERRE
jgi:hypothetical protein